MTAQEIAGARPAEARLHLAGAAFATGGALAWSAGALLIRLVEADAWTLLFWRSTSIAIGMTLYLAAVNRGGVIRALRRAGWPVVIAGLLMAVSMCLYVNAITRTSVANTLFMIATNPFIAAVLAWVVLNERVSPRTWATMAAALVGTATMLGDSIGGGNWLGDVLALGCAATFALVMVVLRRYKNQDNLPQVLMAGLWAMALTLPMAAPAAASWRDILLCAAMGVFSIGLGMLLFVHGLRYISAAEAGLLSLLESILAPIWVWLAIGEQPRPLALLGGAIVLGAVATHAVLTARPNGGR